MAVLNQRVFAYLSRRGRVLQSNRRYYKSRARRAVGVLSRARALNSTGTGPATPRGGTTRDGTLQVHMLNYAPRRGYGGIGFGTSAAGSFGVSSG